MATKTRSFSRRPIWRSPSNIFRITTCTCTEAALHALAEGRRPVVLADHSDRSGYATWVLQELLRRQTRRTLFATVADGPLIQRLADAQARPGDAFDAWVGGRADPSAGEPVRVTGTVLGSGQAQDATGSRSAWVSVAFGDSNVLIVSARLMQITDPQALRAMGLTLEHFDIFVLKSRVHFRRGFHDSGFAPVVLLVEPEPPFLGTTRLGALPYQHLQLQDFYPYGRDTFSA